MQSTKILGTVLVCVWLAGCQGQREGQFPNHRPSPIASAQTPEPENVELEIFEKVGSWKNAAEAWDFAHPECKAALQGENRMHAVENLAYLLSIAKGKELILEPFVAQKSRYSDYPVPSTHRVLAGPDKIMTFLVQVDGTSWKLVLPIPTKHGEEARHETKLGPDEQQKLADKIIAELSEQEKELLKKERDTKGKIAAIKLFRKTRGHSLKLGKMVVESL